LQVQDQLEITENTHKIWQKFVGFKTVLDKFLSTVFVSDNAKDHLLQAGCCSFSEYWYGLRHRVFGFQSHYVI